MLIPVIFVVAFMIALTGALLENGSLGAKLVWQNAVAQYSDVAIADGVADFTLGLATFVASHGASGPWPRQPARSALKSACDSTASARPCSFHYVVAATITAASHADAAISGDTAANLQASGINEQRVSAIVTATVVASTGIAVGTRTRFLTYRVFDTAPYAVISGSRDIATVNGTQSAAQGDSGGASATQSWADRTRTAGFDDTRIHVRLKCSTVINNVKPFENDQQVAGNDGLPWGVAARAAYETPCTSADIPADDFRTERWDNGDVNVSGWTQ